MNMKKSSGFGSGLMFGAVLGGIAALFFSPKSGKENREVARKKAEELQRYLKDEKIDERVQELFGEVSDEARKAYQQIRPQLAQKIAEVTKGELTYDQIVLAINEIVEKAKRESEPLAKHMEKARTSLLAKYRKAVEREGQSDGEKQG